eukprot:SAG31_NODE_50281_length_117_cov_15.666667_1_plen_22_part_01
MYCRVRGDPYRALDGLEYLGTF